MKKVIVTRKMRVTGGINSANLERNEFRVPFLSYSTQSATKMLVSWGCLP